MKYYIDGPPNLQINEKQSLTNKKTVDRSEVILLFRWYTYRQGHADLESYGVLADGEPNTVDSSSALTAGRLSIIHAARRLSLSKYSLQCKRFLRSRKKCARMFLLVEAQFSPQSSSVIKSKMAASTVRT